MSEESLLYQTVGSQVPTKKRLLIEAAKLFTLKGYTATSIDEITHACSIQKPSFYGHFTSKEAIAVAAIQDLLNYCRQHLFYIVDDNSLDKKTKLLEFSKQFALFFSNRADHALVCFLATQTIDKLKTIRQAILDYDSSWQNNLIQLIAPFLGEKQCQQHVLAVQTQLYGGMTMTKIHNNPDILQHVCQDIMQTWDQIANT